jgi:serine/threonine protein kinase
VLTPAYAPPEMFRHDTPSGAADVYALCATLYAVMSGRPPRWATNRSPSLLTLMDLFHQPIPELPNAPRPLTDVLRYGMNNDPASRPTAEQLRDLLNNLHLDPSTPQPPPTVYRSAATNHVPPPRPRPIPPSTPTLDETPTVHQSQKNKGFFQKWFGG